MRRMLQFRLRRLLLIITLSGIVAGLYQSRMLPKRQQLDAAASLTGKGARIEWRPLQPAWLRKLLAHFIEPYVLRTAVAIKAEHCRLQLEGLRLSRLGRRVRAAAPRARLGQLRELWLYVISDAGMPHIGELGGLARLSINGRVTDEGSRFLDVLPKLEYQDARWTQISKARLNEFNTRQPRVYARTDSSSSTLLCLVQAQDPQAWQRLVDLYAPLIYRWCRRCNLQADDAADVAQEVFARTFIRLAARCTSCCRAESRSSVRSTRTIW